MDTGDRVKIKAPKYKTRPLTGLDAAFEDSLGTIVEVEMDGRTKMFRVRLDAPVKIEGQGMVRDDLWSREYLRPTVR